MEKGQIHLHGVRQKAQSAALVQFLDQTLRSLAKVANSFLASKTSKWFF